MVRWDADKNAYITGAVLAELKMTISNEVVQAVLDAWRKLIFPHRFVLILLSRSLVLI